MKYLRLFFRETREYAATFSAVVLCHILLVGMTLLYVFLSKRLVDDAAEVLRMFRETAGGWSEFSSLLSGSVPGRDLLTAAVIFAAVTLLRPGIASVRSYLSVKMSVSMANSLRKRLFDNLLHIRYEYSRKYHSGDMINRLQNDVSLIADSFCVAVPNFIGASLQFAAAFVYLLVLEARLAWILIIVIPIAIFGSRYVMLKVRNLTLGIRQSDSAVQSHIQESFQHITLLQTLEYSEASSDSLEELQSDNYRRNMRRNRFSVLARCIVGAGFSLGYALAFGWGVFGIAYGTVTYGLMTAFLQLVGQVQRPLVQMSDQLPSMFHSLASMDRLEEITSLPREEVLSQHFVGGTAGIRFENVSFSYKDPDVRVFDGLSYDFAPGSRTAITGPTGIGKSTMIRLMLALLTPESGRIVLYGNEVAEASPSTRCNLVYVPQGNSLFSGTIRDNLLMGDPAAGDDRLMEALHTAAADFVKTLPDGLDTLCVETGGGLSEGQAQRIAIARALLRPGTILLLDEFSSALDARTEEVLMERLTKELSSRTMIFITHREKIIRYCDAELNLS